MREEPQTVDRRQSKLPFDLLANAESIARRAHAEWRMQRAAMGWRCGPRRDEERKEDASLFEFDLLPQMEREYMHSMVLATLAAAVALGYQIVPPPDHRAATPPQKTPPPASCDPPDGLGLADLVRDWRRLETVRPGMAVEASRRLGEELLRLGEPVMAYDFALAALETHQGDVRLRQLQALALSRCGATDRANQVLRQLLDEGCVDEETLGLLARTHKDLWLHASDDETRDANLRQSHMLYLWAYRSTGGIYSGINAASTALWLGQPDTAVELAREIQGRCLADLERLGGPAADPYWTLTTLGEAALLAGDFDVARQWYARAFAASNGRLGDFHSTRRQARLVLGSLGFDPHALDATLPMPRVALFCGRAGEQPSLSTQRFSPEAEAGVSEAIQRMLLESDVGVGFASVSDDAELLFFEALRNRRGLAYAVLPYEKDSLLIEQPGTAASARRERLEAALRAATQVLTVSEFGVPSNVLASDYAQTLMYGLARLQAESLETDLIGFAVDGENQADGGRGLQRWREWGLDVKVINLPEGPSPSAESAALSQQHAVADPQVSSRIVALLFADVKGFSKLNEAQVPLFFQHFMGLVAEILRSGPRLPLLRNTWGDGLYLVFDSVRDAGRFALELCEQAAAVDWRQKGLPADLAIRIGLHAGPAWQCEDPVMGMTTFTGTHVSRAARIEPITPPGQVYASQAFAALASAEGESELRFEYVGRTPLAKDYGTLPIYHVRRHI